MERQRSALRLLVSFCGVNLLIAGLFVVLVPHFLLSRVIHSRARRAAVRRHPEPDALFGR